MLGKVHTYKKSDIFVTLTELYFFVRKFVIVCYKLHYGMFMSKMK